MDLRFEKIHKILSNMPAGLISRLANMNDSDINGISIFNEDGTLNKKLMTKQGFLSSIIDNFEENEKMKFLYEGLYDAIANMDDNSEMSEDELKFLASLGKNSSIDIIDKDDFMGLGLFNRDIGKYIRFNDNNINIETEKHIISSKHVLPQKNITAVNEELEINGKIDEPVIQGSVGDCWLLSGINSLNSTEIGKQIIRNAIIPNEDGTITVNFAGLDKQITLTADEIKENDTDLNFHDNYANGDNDALVLEMAMQKLIEENPMLIPELGNGINGGQTYNFWRALVPNHNITFLQEEPIKPMKIGQTYVASSEGSDIFSGKIREVFKQALHNKNIAMEFSNDGHSKAITDVQENQITYIDSMDYTQRTITWNDFIGMRPRSFSYIDLTK